MATPQKISARQRRSEIQNDRICQADIFQDIEIIENISVDGDKISIQKLSFPFAICLNQECDLEQDFNSRVQKSTKPRILHCAVAPVFLFESYLAGSHWGEIFDHSSGQRRKDTNVQKIINNENPRYHYLKFPEQTIPEMIIDFKHFFSVNTDYLYSVINNRYCCMDDLFREQISHRFSYYISRIGLPLHKE